MRRTTRRSHRRRRGSVKQAHRGKACKAVKTLCTELKKRPYNRSCKLHRAARRLCKHTTCKTRKAGRK